MKHIRVPILLLALLASQAWADESGYWSIEIPTPEYATNIGSESDREFFIKTVTFDVAGVQPGEIGGFYQEFFSGIGWSDPMVDMADRGNQHSHAGEWSSYRMGYNQSGQPEANYARGWRSADPPALGSLQLLLSDYSDAGFSGKVTVTIAPEVDMSPLMKLSQLLGNEPESLFYLHNAVGANLFEIQYVTVPANYDNEKNELLSQYYKIVSEITQEYLAFGEKYVNQ